MKQIATRIYRATLHLHDRTEVHGFTHNCLAHPLWWLSARLLRLVGIEPQENDQ